MPGKGDFTILVDESDAGKRLDAVISLHLTDRSRSFSAHLIRKGAVKIRGGIKKPGYRVRPGDLIQGRILPAEPLQYAPEAIPIDVLFEDESLIVLNKPPGLVVHPAPGHHSGTLVNALLHHCPDLEGIGGVSRPGIVHRLDKNTSGVLVVAKNDRVHQNLSAQFKSRKIGKKYLALVYGVVGPDSGTVSLPIGRHPVDRKKMSTVSRKGRSAETGWKVKARYAAATLLELDLKTGRTHQIRVHCAAMGYPIIGDPVYFSRRVKRELSADKALGLLIKGISRQMLHARRLAFVHPETAARMRFEAPLPGDMRRLVDDLKSGRP